MSQLGGQRAQREWIAFGECQYAAPDLECHVRVGQREEFRRGVVDEWHDVDDRARAEPALRVRRSGCHHRDTWQPCHHECVEHLTRAMVRVLEIVDDDDDRCASGYLGNEGDNSIRQRWRRRHFPGLQSEREAQRRDMLRCNSCRPIDEMQQKHLQERVGEGLFKGDRTPEQHRRPGPACTVRRGSHQCRLADARSAAHQHDSRVACDYGVDDSAYFTLFTFATEQRPATHVP